MIIHSISLARVVAVGAGISLLACASSTDASNRLDVENDLPVPIVATLDGANGVMIGAHTTQTFSRSGHQSLRWDQGFSANPTVGYTQTIPVSDTTHRIAISLHPAPDTTIFLLEASNPTGGARAVALVDPTGFGLCTSPFVATPVGEFEPVGIFVFNPQDIVQVFSSGTCSGAFTTISADSLRTLYDTTTGIVKVIVH